MNTTFDSKLPSSKGKKKTRKMTSSHNLLTGIIPGHHGNQTSWECIQGESMDRISRERVMNQITDAIFGSSFLKDAEMCFSGLLCISTSDGSQEPDVKSQLCSVIVGRRQHNCSRSLTCESAELPASIEGRDGMQMEGIYTN